MDTTQHIRNVAHRRSIRALTLGVALAAAGLVAPAGAGAGWNTQTPDQAPQERAALIEGTHPANVPVATCTSVDDDVVITRRPNSWDV